MVKVSLLQAMKAHGGYGCKGPHIHTAVGRGRVARPTLGCLYHRGNPRYSFYRRLSGSQNQSGHKGVNKTCTLPTLGIEPGPSRP